MGWTDILEINVQMKHLYVMVMLIVPIIQMNTQIALVSVTLIKYYDLQDKKYWCNLFLWLRSEWSNSQNEILWILYLFEPYKLSSMNEVLSLIDDAALTCCHISKMQTVHIKRNCDLQRKWILNRGRQLKLDSSKWKLSSLYFCRLYVWIWWIILFTWCIWLVLWQLLDLLVYQWITDMWRI